MAGYSISEGVSRDLKWQNKAVNCIYKSSLALANGNLLKAFQKGFESIAYGLPSLCDLGLLAIGLTTSVALLSITIPISAVIAPFYPRGMKHKALGMAFSPVLLAMSNEFITRGLGIAGICIYGYLSSLSS